MKSAMDVLRDLSPMELVGILIIVVLIFKGKAGPVMSDIFRGGPTPPSHPLPGDDSRLLTRRRARTSLAA
jgi:hypothetical protein